MKTRERLNCDTLTVTPRNYNWSKGYGEAWESWQAEECPECGRVIVGSGEIACRDYIIDAEDAVQPETGCTGTVYLEGPMMSYYYPLPDDVDPEDAARKLSDFPLAVVKFDGGDEDADSYGLALTGGGMDLSWEICGAFVALGYMPPRHFWNVPKMSGYKTTPTRRRVLAAIAAGIETETAWLKNDKRRLSEIRAYLRENDRRAK